MLQRLASVILLLAFAAGCAAQTTPRSGPVGGQFSGPSKPSAQLPPGPSPRPAARAPSAPIPSRDVSLREDIRPDNPFLDPAFVQQAHRTILEQFGVYRDVALTRYVQGVADRLSDAGGAPDVTVTIVDIGGVNAFAGAGGYVYITRGLLMLAISEDELAFVLAHEIAHVVAQDVERRYERLREAEAAATEAVGAAASRGDARSRRDAIEFAVAVQATLAAASRRDELEADEAGGEMLVAAGYSPWARVDMLRRLEDWSRFEGRPTGATWMDTHPSSPERVAIATRAATAEGAVARATTPQSQYYDQIDGLPVFNAGSGVRISIEPRGGRGADAQLSRADPALRRLLELINGASTGRDGGRFVKILVDG